MPTAGGSSGSSLRAHDDVVFALAAAHHEQDAGNARGIDHVIFERGQRAGQIPERDALNVVPA